MMLMALPTLGPVLLLAMCSFTCFTLPQALHMRQEKSWSAGMLWQHLLQSMLTVC